MDFLYSGQIDRLLNWQPGTAARLVQRGKLPHYVLPDGSIRFKQTEVLEMVRRVPACEDKTVPEAFRSLLEWILAVKAASEGGPVDPRLGPMLPVEPITEEDIAKMELVAKSLEDGTFVSTPVRQ